MTAPYRPRGEYWILVLVGVLALGLGLGVAVAKYASTGFSSATPSPSVSPRPTASASPSTPAPAATAATAGWTRYSDAADAFALRYPATWQPRTCSTGGHTTLYLAPTDATLGACNSGFGGQMSVGAVGGDQRATYQWTSPGGYDNIKSQPVIVAGVSATRQTATVPDSAAAGPVPGSRMAQYLVYANGRTYIAVYAQAPSAPDTLADFDTMMKTTLEITAH